MYNNNMLLQKVSIFYFWSLLLSISILTTHMNGFKNKYIAKTLNFHVNVCICVRVVRTCELRRKSNIKGPVVIDVMPLKKTV